MSKKIIKDELYEMTYIIKQIIANVSLEKYEDSIYDLLSILDYVHSIRNEINKENF